MEGQRGELEVLEQLCEATDGGDRIGEYESPVLRVIKQERVEVEVLWN